MYFSDSALLTSELQLLHGIKSSVKKPDFHLWKTQDKIFRKNNSKLMPSKIENICPNQDEKIATIIL